jgi:cytochrome c oxidase subunit II
MYQTLAWTITLPLVILVALLFSYVAWHAQKRGDHIVDGSRPISIGAWGFWGLVLVLTAVIVYSSRFMPYAAPAGFSTTPQIVEVVGHQWDWKLSRAVVNVGSVEFHVTSDDVNHGFGLYSPELRLLVQTQAMPGYVNVIRYEFTKPGTYPILCLEYCGLAHHAMQSQIRVSANEAR